MISRQDCIQMDERDDLAHLRSHFDLPDGLIYLDGNSLGARPRLAMARAKEVVEQQWGADLITSWNRAGWFDLPVKLGDMIAPLIGAGPGQVVVTDSTSINLFKALAAALEIQGSNTATAARKTIVTERSNFPTDV